MTTRTILAGALMPLALLAGCAGGSDDTQESPVSSLDEVLAPDGITTTNDNTQQEIDMTVMVLEDMARPGQPILPPQSAADTFAAPPRVWPDVEQIQFGFDATALTLRDRLALSDHAAFLKLNPEQRLIITGHTDATGPEAYNRQLSYRRARAVADYLMDQGVPEDKLVIQGEGSDRPLAHKASDDEQRRVELEYQSGSFATR